MIEDNEEWNSTKLSIVILISPSVTDSDALTYFRFVDNCKYRRRRGRGMTTRRQPRQPSNTRHHPPAPREKGVSCYELPAGRALVSWNATVNAAVRPSRARHNLKARTQRRTHPGALSRARLQFGWSTAVTFVARTIYVRSVPLSPSVYSFHSKYITITRYTSTVERNRPIENRPIIMTHATISFYRELRFSFARPILAIVRMYLVIGSSSANFATAAKPSGSFRRPFRFYFLGNISSTNEKSALIAPCETNLHTCLTSHINISRYAFRRTTPSTRYFSWHARRAFVLIRDDVNVIRSLACYRSDSICDSFARRSVDELSLEARSWLFLTDRCSWSSNVSHGHTVRIRMLML